MSIRKQIESKRARTGVLNGNAQALSKEVDGHLRREGGSAEQILVEALIHEEWRVRMASASWFEYDNLNRGA